MIEPTFLPTEASAGDVTEPQIVHPKTTALMERWYSEKPQTGLPTRASFDPLDLKQFLGNLIILQVEPDFLSSWYRLYGTNLVDYFGVELTGIKLKDVPADHPRKIQAEYERVIDTGEPVVCKNQALIGESIYFYEKLLLPLSEDGENIKFILVSIYRIES